MRWNFPEEIYLVTLRVIQPARVQDIETAAGLLFDLDDKPLPKDFSLRDVHKLARSEGWVLQARKGLYVLTQKGAGLIRDEEMFRELDNRRLFLIKEKRRQIM